MTSIPFTATPDSISLFLDGRMRTVQKTHMNFASIAAIVKDVSKGVASSTSLDRLREMVDIPSFIAKVTEGRVAVSDNEVQFDGKPLHNYATKRLLDMLRDGFDIRPLARFLDRLEKNPYALEAAKDELYRFLERGNMPLTEDGCFLAFKRVREDFSSIHNGPEPVFSIPGTRVEFPRERLRIEQRGMTCSSSGLHVCSYGYLPHFHAYDGNKVVVVKCAPEDLWSIPAGENDLKCQMVGYDVLREVPYEEVEHLFQGVSWTDEQGEAYEPGGDDDPRTCDEPEDCSGDPCHCEDARTPGLGDDDPFPETGRGDEVTERAERDAEAHGHPVVDAKDDLQARLKAQSAAFKDAHGHHGVTFNKLRKLVEKHGQREASRRTGVPRATIQRWLAVE